MGGGGEFLRFQLVSTKDQVGTWWFLCLLLQENVRKEHVLRSLLQQKYSEIMESSNQVFLKVEIC